MMRINNVHRRLTNSRGEMVFFKIMHRATFTFLSELEKMFLADGLTEIYDIDYFMT